MKVILSSYASLPHSGGESGVGWNWMLSLAQECEFVHVLTRAGNQAQITAYTRREGLPSNVRFHFVELPDYLSFISGIVTVHYFLWQVYAYRYARDYLRADLVHHVSLGSFQGGTWMWLLGLPVVFGPVGGGQIAPPQARRYFPSRRWSGEQLRTAITKVASYSPWHLLIVRKAATLVLATNGATAQLARSMGARQVAHFIDSGVDESFLAQERYVALKAKGVTTEDQAAGDTATGRTAAADEEVHILWVGRLVPRKALRLALEAVAVCRAPLRLTVVGDGEQRADAERWIDELGVRHRVTLRGHVPWPEMAQYYDTHDLLLFTSLRESFGTQLMEAAARGLPIVVLNLNGGEALPADCAFKVPLGSPEEMARDLASAIEAFHALPPAERQRMSCAAREFAANQTWPKRAQAMSALYRQLLSDGQQAAGHSGRG